MLSNAYLLAKFRFDTAKNEPAKNLQNFRKMHFSKMHFSKMHFSTGPSSRFVKEGDLDLPVLQKVHQRPAQQYELGFGHIVERRMHLVPKFRQGGFRTEANYFLASRQAGLRRERE